MNYQTAIEEFILSLRERGYAVITLFRIKLWLKHFGRYLEEKKIGDIKSVQREDVLGYVGKIDRSKENKIRVVQQLFRYLKEREVIFLDPAEGIKNSHRVKSLPRIILSKAEMEKLLSAPNTGMLEGIRDKALLELLYSTGLRLCEVIKLKVEDIDLKGGSLTVWEGKGKKDRLIPVGKTAVRWLTEYIRKVRPYFVNERIKEPALFISVNGERLGSHWVADCLKGYARQGKIEKQVTAHIIRHSMASHLLLEGAKIEIVQRILGHESIRTTCVYTHIIPNDLKQMHRKTHPRED